MKNLKKVLSSAIALVMLCSMTAFNGVRAEAKEVPKYLIKDNEFISKACMYENKSVVYCDNGTTKYYEGKVQKNTDFQLGCGNKISKEEMYYYNDNHEGYIYNLRTKSNTKAKDIENKLNNVIENKYSVGMRIEIIKSENGVYWAEFESSYYKKMGVVSSNGDIIEMPYSDTMEKDGIKFYKDKAYALIKDGDEYKLNVSTLNENKVYNIQTNESVKASYLQNLYVNDNGIYILRVLTNDSSDSKICKINLSDDKANLIGIAKHTDILSPVTTDNNDNIWYLENGLVYKIENDSPSLKYEVNKDAYNLFVSDDYNAIVSGPYENGNTLDRWSTIINLSDKYTNGWAKEGNSWYYYIDRQCVTSEWKQLDGKWYAFGADGAMLTGWANDEYGNWYFLNDNGAMATGWKQLEGAWYYLNDNGSMAKGWKKVGTSWYYLYNNGVMAHDTIIEGYKIGSNGAMI